MIARCPYCAWKTEGELTEMIECGGCGIPFPISATPQKFVKHWTKKGAPKLAINVRLAPIERRLPA